MSTTGGAEMQTQVVLLCDVSKRQASRRSHNLWCPDLSSKTCGSFGGHMQLIGDESHAWLSQEACAGGLREQPGNYSCVIFRWPKWIHLYDCVPLSCTYGWEVRWGSSESPKGFALQVQTRHNGEPVETHELSHLMEDGGVASGRTCQSPASICERF